MQSLKISPRSQEQSQKLSEQQVVRYNKEDPDLRGLPLDKNWVRPDPANPHCFYGKFHLVVDENTVMAAENAKTVEERGTPEEISLFEKLTKLQLEAASQLESYAGGGVECVAAVVDFLKGKIECCAIPFPDGTEATVNAPCNPGNESILYNGFARIFALMKFVFENEAKSDLGRYACNVTNVGIRQFITVGIFTYLRQKTAYDIQHGTDASRTENLEIMATFAAIYPIVINIAAIFWDRYHNEDTTSSTISRVAVISACLGLFIHRAETGTLVEIAPTLFSFIFMYTIGRDIFQLLFRLTDTVKQYYVAPVMVSAVAYLLNQFLVNLEMDSWASPSGQTTGNQTYGEIWPNDARRGAFNWLGEVSDQLCVCVMQVLYLMFLEYWNSNSNKSDISDKSGQPDEQSRSDVESPSQSPRSRWNDPPTFDEVMVASVNAQYSQQSYSDQKYLSDDFSGLGALLGSDDELIELSPRHETTQNEGVEAESKAHVQPNQKIQLESENPDDDGKLRFRLQFGTPLDKVLPTIFGVHSARAVIFAIVLQSPPAFAALILAVCYFPLISIATRENFFYEKEERTDHTSYR